jgi:hypothetical protein
MLKRRAWEMIACAPPMKVDLKIGALSEKHNVFLLESALDAR